MNDLANDDRLSGYIEAMPKAELHLHMEGSLRPELLLRLAGRNKLDIPFTHPDQFRGLYRYRTFKDFSKLLLLGVYCLRRPEDFFDLILDMGETLSVQNIRYAEITWTPQFYLNRQCSLDDILGAMNAARTEAADRWEIELRWIPDLVRSYPGPGRVVARWAAKARQQPDSGVVALGLGGPEAGHPARGFSALFREARALGLPANPHAGEGVGPESVRETIEELRPSRIGHGIRSVEDRALVEHLAQTALPLEVCLTSNVKLGIYTSHAEHPVKHLIEAGCTVILNSDDPVLFQTTLGDEYLHAIRDCGLGLSDIRNSILDAIRSSYLTDSEKAAMAETFGKEFGRLDGVFRMEPRDA